MYIYEKCTCRSTDRTPGSMRMWLWQVHVQHMYCERFRVQTLTSNKSARKLVIATHCRSSLFETVVFFRSLCPPPPVQTACFCTCLVRQTHKLSIASYLRLALGWHRRRESWTGSHWRAAPSLRGPMHVKMRPSSCLTPDRPLVSTSNFSLFYQRGVSFGGRSKPKVRFWAIDLSRRCACHCLLDEWTRLVLYFIIHARRLTPGWHFFSVLSKRTGKMRISAGVSLALTVLLLLSSCLTEVTSKGEFLAGLAVICQHYSVTSLNAFSCTAPSRLWRTSY